MSTAPVIVQSRIVGATVFSDLAHVTRQAAVTLIPGLNRLAFEDLPRNLDPAAIRVRTSLGTVRFVEGDDLSWSADADKTPEEQELLDAARKVHRLEGELQALQAEVELIDRLAPGRGLPSPHQLGPLRPEAFAEGLDVVVKRRRDALYASRVAAYELHRAQEHLRTLEARQQAAGQTARPAERAVVVVGLDVEAPGEAELSLIYDAAWATWRPYYALRLEDGGNTVEVARFADVWQQTGEDWPDVALRLSSAEPEEGLEVPQVLPWILERRQQIQGDPAQLYKKERLKRPSMPAPKMSRRMAPGPAASMAPPAAAPALMRKPAPQADVLEDEATRDLDYDDLEVAAPSPDAVMDNYAQQFDEEGIFASVTSSGLVAASYSQPYTSEDGTDGGGGAPPRPPAAPPPPGPPQPRRRHPPPGHPDFRRLLELPTPQSSSGGIDFEQVVAGGVALPSGSGHQRVALSARRYSAQVQYLLRPAAKDHAFGRVEVVNAEPEPLLQGPAALFVDGAFFGTTQVRTTPADGKLVLDLGAQTALKCARRSKTTVRTEGLISKDDVHAVHVTIEVESFLDVPAAVEVQDQYPVSTDEKVKVKLLLPKAGDAELDERNGILTFRRTVAPRGRLELHITYEIEVPKDYQIHQLLTETTS